MDTSFFLYMLAFLGLPRVFTSKVLFSFRCSRTRNPLLPRGLPVLAVVRMASFSSSGMTPLTNSL